jgi:hypothetical protein
MKIKKLMIGAITSTFLGLGFSSIYFNPASSVAKAAVQAQTVNEALKKIPFKVKQPKKFPFKVSGRYAFVHNEGHNKMIEITYVNKGSGACIVLRATKANVVPINKNEFKTSKSKKLGITLFQDNNNTQNLQWKQDRISYTIIASSGNAKHFTEIQLQQIAESLK